MSLKRNHRQHGRRGATIVLMVLLIIGMLAMVAFAVDVGRMYLARSQLQTAVDAGAMAAALQLGKDSTKIEDAVIMGKEFTQLNRVGSFVTVPEEAITVEAGYWDSAARKFTLGSPTINAIQVSGTLDREPLFFGAVLGRTLFAVPRAAIAQSGGSKMDIMMTLDLSGSMASQGRIEALQAAAPIFVDTIKSVEDDDRIGVMGYGAVPSMYNPVARGHRGVSYLSAPPALYPANSTWCAVKEADLSSDLKYIKDDVLNKETLLASKFNGWTPTGAAIRDSAHYLDTNARIGVEKVIVLMSDGHANKPDGNGPGYALQMADYAASLNIKIFAISLGNAADENLMQQIANRTGGEHYIASGAANELPQKLKDAFTKAAAAIKQSQLVQ